MTIRDSATSAIQDWLLIETSSKSYTPTDYAPAMKSKGHDYELHGIHQLTNRVIEKHRVKQVVFHVHYHGKPLITSGIDELAYLDFLRDLGKEAKAYYEKPKFEVA